MLHERIPCFISMTTRVLQRPIRKLIFFLFFCFHGLLWNEEPIFIARRHTYAAYTHNFALNNTLLSVINERNTQYQVNTMKNGRSLASIKFYERKVGKRERERERNFDVLLM